MHNIFVMNVAVEENNIMLALYDFACQFCAVMDNIGCIGGVVEQGVPSFFECLEVVVFWKGVCVEFIEGFAMMVVALSS